MCKKSTKIVGAIVVVVALLLFIALALPAITGGMVKKQINGWQQKASAADKQLRVQVTHYHRGWFHSSADVNISTRQLSKIEAQLLKADANADLPQRIVLNVRLNIAHGPFAHLAHLINGHNWFWGAGMAKATVSLAQPTIDQYSELPVLTTPLMANMLLKWDGTLVIWLKQQPGTVYADPSTQVSIQGIHSKLIISRNFDQFNSRTQVNKLKIQFKRSGELTMDTISHELTSQRHNDGIWYGKSVVTIPSARFTIMSREAAKLEKIVIAAGNEKASDKSLTIRDRLSIGKMLIMGQKVGAFAIDVSIDKLNPKAFVEFRGLYEMLEQQLAGTSPQEALPKDAKTQQIIGQIQPVVSEFLKGVELRLNTLQLQTGRGTAKLTGVVKLPEKVPAEADNEQDWIALIKLASGEATFTVSPRLLSQALALAQLSPRFNERIEEWIGAPTDTASAQQNALALLPMFHQLKQQGKVEKALLQKGWLRKEGSNYVVYFRYRQQQLTVNDKPLEKLLPSPSSVQANQ